MLLITILVLFFGGQSTPLLMVDADSAEAHVLRRVRPGYPPIALAARVEGTVGLTVTVSPSGTVERAVPVRSIPLLDQAAIDAVKAWQFEPFVVSGQPARIETEIDVTFYVDPRMERLADEVRARARGCRALLSQKRFADAEPLCGEAANLAGKLAAADRASVYHLAGEMFAGRGNHAKAIEAFTAEVKLRGRQTSQGMTRARQALADAYAASGDVQAARREFDRAEKAAREYLKAEQDAIARIAPDRVSATARIDQAQTLLKSVLTHYATCLENAGLTIEAAEVRKRLAHGQ